MPISFKYIIHKVDKLINPKKYYTNNVTKKIKTLINGDKLYTLYLPKFEQLRPYRWELLNIMKTVKLMTTKVICVEKNKLENTKFITMEILFEEYQDNLFKNLYCPIYTEEGYIIRLSVEQKEVNKTIVEEK